MRHFVYYEPLDVRDNDFTPVEIVMTEQDILNEYWDIWSQRMIEAGLTPTKEECIQDWKVIHWAEEYD